MFRRRRLVRPPILRPGRRIPPPLPPQATAPIKQAHRLMQAGDHQAAAALFEHTAQQADAHHMPRAAYLFLQAGNAWLLAHQVDAAMPVIKRGLMIFAETGRWGEFHRFSDEAVLQLTRSGFDDNAQNLRGWVEEMQPRMPQQDTQTTQRKNLPAQCPYCGGGVDPRDVEWLDDVSAGCAFCGGIIKVL